MNGPQAAATPRRVLFWAVSWLVSALREGAIRSWLFATGFAAMVPVHALARDQVVDGRIATIAVVFLVGSLPGLLTAWLIVALLGSRGNWSARFSLALIAIMVCVPLATAFIFFLQYRIYFSAWHDPAFTEVWIWQILFTGATAVYLFVVSAIPFILPLGLLLIVAAAWSFARPWSAGHPVMGG
ncbi:MAG: hypothetical protein AAGF59_03465 [Pseudomonadota bacterium]